MTYVTIDPRTMFNVKLGDLDLRRSARRSFTLLHRLIWATFAADVRANSFSLYAGKEYTLYLKPRVPLKAFALSPGHRLQGIYLEKGFLKRVV